MTLLQKLNGDVEHIMEKNYGQDQKEVAIITTVMGIKRTLTDQNVIVNIMGIRFQKRIKLGEGLGLNISKSGVSTSYRNKRGSLSSKGFSIRTGIPGLTYRKSFSKAKNSGCASLFLVLLTVTLTFIITK